MFALFEDPVMAFPWCEFCTKLMRAEYDASSGRMIGEVRILHFSLSRSVFFLACIVGLLVLHVDIAMFHLQPSSSLLSGSLDMWWTIGTV